MNFDKDDWKVINGLRKSGIKDEVINVMITFAIEGGIKKLSKQENYLITIAAGFLTNNIDTQEKALNNIIKHKEFYEKVRNNIRYS